MVRTVGFKYVILRNGANYGILPAPVDSTHQIHMDTEAEIKTSLIGDFFEPEKDVDFMTDKIQPVMILDGKEYPLGIFLPVHVSMDDSDYVKKIHIEAYDQCWYVKAQKVSVHPPFFPAGTNYINAISSLLSTCNIALIYAVSTSEVMTEDRADWGVGTSYLTIVNELLKEINYNDLWFDNAGIAQLTPFEAPDAKFIDHTLSDKDIKSLMIHGMSSTMDIYEIPNEIVVTCSNPDKEGGMIALAENTNPQSPLSIARRGMRITKVININNIASQEALQSYANRLMTETMSAEEEIMIDTLLLPGFGVGDTIGFKYGDLMAICKETAWTMELKVGGHMTHVLNRRVLNIDQ